MAQQSTAVETRQGQVTEQCQELDKDLEALLESITHLESQLLAVLLPMTKEDMVSPPRQDLVPHACYLADKRDTVGHAREMIDSLRQRLEL